jgi:uncharacterized membrane protein (UPF0127 family)
MRGCRRRSSRLKAHSESPLDDLSLYPAAACKITPMKSLRRALAHILLALSFVALPTLAVCAQEPVIPRVAPRPATTLLMLPDGSTVHVELAATNAEREYGLMGRTSLPAGRGMLFIHDQPGRYAYWMYHCKIGLDILWMDPSHHIVDISPDTPPCKGASKTCASYGGHATSLYVLGSIKAHQLAVGQVVNFNVVNSNAQQ